MSQGNSSIFDPPYPTAPVLLPPVYLFIRLTFVFAAGGSSWKAGRQRKMQQGRKADQTWQLDKLWIGRVDLL